MASDEHRCCGKASHHDPTGDDWNDLRVVCSCGFDDLWPAAIENHAEYLGRHEMSLLFADGCTWSTTTTPTWPGADPQRGPHRHVCQPHHSAYRQPRPPEVDCLYCGRRLYVAGDRWILSTVELTAARAGQLALDL